MEDLMKIDNCPFCGSFAFVISTLKTSDETITFYKLHHPPESKCSISMMATSKSDLIKRWNRRIRQ